jgi:hypothetical protein
VAAVAESAEALGVEPVPSADGATRQRDAGTGPSSNHWSSDAPPKDPPACASKPNRRPIIPPQEGIGAAYASANSNDSYSRVSIRWHRVLGERAIVQQKIMASSGRVRGHKGRTDRVPRTAWMENRQIRYRMGWPLRCGRSHRQRSSQFERETNKRFRDRNDQGSKQGCWRPDFGTQVCDLSGRWPWVVASSRDHRPLAALSAAVLASHGQAA